MIFKSIKRVRCESDDEENNLKKRGRKKGKGGDTTSVANKRKRKKGRFRMPRFIKRLSPVGRLKLVTMLILSGIKITTLIICLV